MKEPLAKDQDKFVLRLPDGMRERIKRVADGNNRSMNAEIVATLEEQYPVDDLDLGEILSRWLIPITKETSEPLKLALFHEANDVLAKENRQARLELHPLSDGRSEVVLVLDGMTFKAKPVELDEGEESTVTAILHPRSAEKPA